MGSSHETSPISSSAGAWLAASVTGTLAGLASEPSLVAGRVSTTVRCVIANSTTGGTAATHAASPPGTVASAATTACSALAVTETSAPPISNVHGYQAARVPARATTATVATTMIPSTINGHAHASPVSMPDRRARSAREVKLSQNAPAAMNTVPATAVTTAQRRPVPPGITTPARHPPSGTARDHHRSARSSPAAPEWALGARSGTPSARWR